MYYRVYDLQTKTYFLTGYNAESMPDLINSFQNYINGSITILEDDTVNLTTWQEIAEHLQGVDLEESETPFEDID